MLSTENTIASSMVKFTSVRNCSHLLDQYFMFRILSCPVPFLQFHGGETRYRGARRLTL